MLPSLHQFTTTPLFGVTLTIGAYGVAHRLWLRGGRHPLLTPVLVAIALVVAVLHVAGVGYADYLTGGDLLSFLLGPATVALAVPLHRAGPSIGRMLRPVLMAVLVGSTAAMATTVVVVRLCGGTPQLEATLAPKSATTPIAIVLASSTGGVAALAAVVTVLTGVLGAVVGPGLLRAVGIHDPRVLGLALGVASHGIGTSRALEEDPLAGAFAALAMALSGISTSLLMPGVLALLG